MFFAEKMSMPLPLACVTDLTPPTFSGITTLTDLDNGALRAAWAAAVDPSAPITYDLYIAQGTVLPASLFVQSNLALSHTPGGAGPFFRDLFSLADGTYLAINETYTVGVRARDALGNQETNVAVLSEVSHGVLPDCLTATAAELTAAIAGVQSILNSIAASGGIDLEVQSPRLDMEVEC